MVFMIIIPMKNGYFIGNIPNIFRQTHISCCWLELFSIQNPTCSIISGTWSAMRTPFLGLGQPDLSNKKSRQAANYMGSLYRQLRLCHGLAKSQCFGLLFPYLTDRSWLIVMGQKWCVMSQFSTILMVYHCRTASAWCLRQWQRRP